MLKKVYKLIDKSVVLGVETSSDNITVSINKPVNLTQMMNPQTGEPEIVFLPLDIIFADVKDEKNSVTLKKEHIIWEKDMSDFPAYESNYVQTTTGIEPVTSGIIKG